LTPHIVIETFLDRRRDDGQHPDHWLRIHLRAGATLLSRAPCIDEYEGSLDQLRGLYPDVLFEEGGVFALPSLTGLVRVDVATQRWVLEERNVWLGYTLEIPPTCI
jgi:hypothetical protein